MPSGVRVCAQQCAELALLCTLRGVVLPCSTEGLCWAPLWCTRDAACVPVLGGCFRRSSCCLLLSRLTSTAAVCCCSFVLCMPRMQYVCHSGGTGAGRPPPPPRVGGLFGVMGAAALAGQTVCLLLSPLQYSTSMVALASLCSSNSSCLQPCVDASRSHLAGLGTTAPQVWAVYCCVLLPTLRPNGRSAALCLILLCCAMGRRLLHLPAASLACCFCSAPLPAGYCGVQHAGWSVVFGGTWSGAVSARSATLTATPVPLAALWHDLAPVGVETARVRCVRGASMPHETGHPEGSSRGNGFCSGITLVWPEWGS